MAKPDASRNDTRYILTDTAQRAHSAQIRAELETHIAEFLARGGKIEQVELSIGPEKEIPFRISNANLLIKKDKQDWKDHAVKTASYNFNPSPLQRGIK